MQRRTALSLLAGASALAAGLPRQARANEVTIGYQLIYNPYAYAVAAGKFEEATGWKINWVKFDSGAKVINAMASGDVQVALAGSSPIAAGVSRGVDMQLFWIVEDIAAAEALVVRDGSGIDIADPKSLEGKKIGVPFVSTTHFHMMYALELWGLDPSQVTLLNMQPNQVVAAWERGDIDGAFVWDPALGRIKKSGKVMITSGELSAKGKATFDGMVVNSGFAADNAEFMAKFVRVVADADSAYRKNKAAWTADSAEVKAIVSLVGGEPAEVPEVLSLYGFPTLEEQASPRWLGGGAEGGAAKALKFTSEFLKGEGRIDALQPDYGKFVTPAFAEAALKLGS
jgi:taurine transport system substrate-binding protein